MNKKKGFIFAILIAILLIGIGIFIYVKNNNLATKKDSYETEKTSVSDTNTSNNTTKDSNTSSAPNEVTKSITESGGMTPPTPTEEQIATFTTKIYSNDAARQNNISITCQTLNGTIIQNGSTFSFCQTVGQASSSKGYQKADIFDKYGNKKKGLGGGNCQISSTLYNAVLSVPSLLVTERHAHSNLVPYIAKGKDAAVAYGSYDFKFRNDFGYPIKILASSDGKHVTTSLVSIK